MGNQQNTTNVHILDKEYMVACPENEREALHRSAALLDSKMRAIRSSGKILGTERIAVMAALNIAHEFLQQHQSQTGSNDSAVRLATKIDEVLQTIS